MPVAISTLRAVGFDARRIGFLISDGWVGLGGVDMSPVMRSSVTGKLRDQVSRSERGPDGRPGRLRINSSA